MAFSKAGFVFNAQGPNTRRSVSLMRLTVLAVIKSASLIVYVIAMFGATAGRGY